MAGPVEGSGLAGGGGGVLKQVAQVIFGTLVKGASASLGESFK